MIINSTQKMLARKNVGDIAPFFSYYGSKWRTIHLYPKPIYTKIIEPFAGSASYSVRYWKLDVTLYDIDPVIYGVWDYLIKSSPKDIMSLPVDFESTDEIKVCQEAKWLIGLWVGNAAASPRKSFSSWSKNRLSSLIKDYFWSEKLRLRLANQLKYIKHWKVFNKSCYFIENTKATWFIDPPYQGEPGRNYKYNKINYEKLGAWSENRRGQVIVCENVGANWLPFRFLANTQTPSSKGRKGISAEAIYTTYNE